MKRYVCFFVAVLWRLRNRSCDPLDVIFVIFRASKPILSAKGYHEVIDTCIKNFVRLNTILLGDHSDLWVLFEKHKLQLDQKEKNCHSNNLDRYAGA